MDLNGILLITLKKLADVIQEQPCKKMVHVRLIVLAITVLMQQAVYSIVL
jgi:hypothetical protein